MAVDESIVSEVVNLADVAVRTASQIRLSRSGRAFSEPAVLAKAQQFLSRAKRGVIFINGGPAADLHDTLRPLNWATDAYLALSPRPANLFAKISDYLDRVLSALTDVIQKPLSAPKRSSDLALTFFEKLGEMLGTEADKLLRDDSDLVSLIPR
jgi:hypothetical protein